METYESILERMNDKFTELSGYAPDEAGDIGIRLRLLAGELFALEGNMEWLRRQMFPETASGRELELHAAQRGLHRLSGSKASGMIAFQLDMPCEYDVVIPQGTICSTADGALRYITSQEYTMHRGTTILMADCEAEHSGKKYNVGIGKVKTIVTYFSVGLKINNSTSFTGGSDDESDEALRKRIAESCRISPDGANSAYYEALAMSVDGIHSAHAYSTANDSAQIVVVLAGRGVIPSQEAVSQARTLIQQAVPLGVTVTVGSSSLTTVNVSVAITPGQGYTYAQAQANAEEAIREYFLGLSVSEDVLLSELGRAIISADGVENYSFVQMQDVSIGNSSTAKLGTLSVTQA